MKSWLMYHRYASVVGKDTKYLLHDLTVPSLMAKIKQSTGLRSLCCEVLLSDIL